MDDGAGLRWAGAPADPGPPPAELIIGVDVGTTAAKVSAFGVGAPWRRTTAQEYPLLHPAPGREEQSPEVLAAAVLTCLRSTVAACGAARVVAVSLSSAMHGLIGLDAAMRPLTPLVTWADSRAADEAAALRRDGRASALHATSGTPVHPMSPLVKLLWFRRNAPDLFARVRYWVGLKDWVVWTLTGTIATELSCASGTGLLDLSTGTWSPTALALVGVDVDRLPPVLATTAAASLSPSAAAATGLPAGLPVVLGAGDGPLGNLGTGAIENGVAGLSIGTSGALRAVVAHPGVDAGGALFCYALAPGAWVVGGAISNGGSVQRWAGGVFGARAADGAADGTAGPLHPDDAGTVALAASVPAGSDGLIAFPYLLAERAPLWDPTLTGAFLGVRSEHTRAHFVRAAVEGVALQLWTVLTRLESVMPVTSIRATGGVFRAPLWPAILSSVLDRPLTVTDGAEGSARGAAALGVIGIGRATSLDGALALLPPPDAAPPVATDPDPADVATYRQVRERIPHLVAAYQDVGNLFAKP